MSEQKSRFVVSADWVEKQLGALEFKIVDASWYLPAHNRNGAAEYAAGHIPGAVFFDLDVIADHSTGLPHTLPAPEVFADAVGKFGISATDTIIVYDGPGFLSAPRVWWTFRIMGAQNVFVIDGGLDGWKAEGRPLETDLPEPAPARFVTHFHPERVTSFAEMKYIVANGSKQIGDARSAGRFAAEEPEPRAGLRSGHMPGAKSLPSGTFASDGKFKDLRELRGVFEAAGIDLSKPVVTSCGSGITAAIITLALESLGHTDNTLYDGSWTEWGSHADTAIETGRG
ncbi:3-mercaptopyruvate sulfurtransferase [Rhizobiaceae bacterium n13]|uniref:3-mercaptopyruvate sulfurtransferase n=1 Tax=Ferirhizobium litorale TaxID=2927786 RepID=A0AAE3QFD2_9HYPH|nr:3-mercaptopyruvate sulfurtransferase [Fererhizobium litorale]MDI7865074.1 3-mercaptopyruvate sulfurtransferase [Fererhizobium litorale]MDI7922913.1 3-mercaptopyruvate sulfurtransferase [Fererhizobium litorale]